MNSYHLYPQACVGGGKIENVSLGLVWSVSGQLLSTESGFGASGLASKKETQRDLNREKQ